jgi:hypothetical protein
MGCVVHCTWVGSQIINEDSTFEVNAAGTAAAWLLASHKRRVTRPVT